MPVTSATHQGGALAAGLALAFGHDQNLAGVNVHYARVHLHDGLGLLVAEPAETETSQAAARASHLGVLGVVAELSDAAHDDRVHPQQLAQFRRGRGIGAIAVGEVLFRQNLVQRLALDHSVGAVLHQARNQQVGNAFADVNVLSENGGHAAVHGGIIEVQDGNELSASAWVRRRGLRQHLAAQAQQQNRRKQDSSFFHCIPPRPSGMARFYERDGVVSKQNGQSDFHRR